MEEQQFAFSITQDGIDLLADILVAAHQYSGVEAGSRDLTEEEQETVIALSGALLVEILRQSEEAEEE